MKSKSILWVGIVVLLAGAGYYYWQHAQLDSAALTPPAKSATSDGDANATQYPVSAPADSAMPGSASSATPTTVPTLDHSDETIEHLLSDLVGQQRFEALINPQDLNRNFVATTDNAKGSKLPSRVSPFKPLTGDFKVDQTADGIVLSADNFARYTPYVDLLTSVDSQKLVNIYARYYPLFQAAYRDLGMSGYFNDRLVSAIDKTLAAPEPKGPIKLESVGYYRFADPDLESRSIVQKILIRMGPQQEDLVKQKLKEWRGLLTHLNKK